MPDRRCYIAGALLLLSLLLALALSVSPSLRAQPLQEQPTTGHLLTIDGAIGPASADYIVRGISAANEDNAALIIIAMDTPGGLDLSMRDIIQAILDSRVPVVSYVSPQGARAASAGTYILYASHVAAMAPATNLGAATPVQLGAPSLPTDTESEDDSTDDNEAGASASERKALNDALAYIRSLAEKSGRNAEWAEAAVRDAATLSAAEALSEGVIDLVAEDLDDLLSQLNGRELTINNQPRTLATQDLQIVPVDADWRTGFLAIISNPNLILLLAMIGFYGVLIEFYNPGFGFAGVTGAICLLLAGYGLQLLPLNYAGLALIVLGLILIIAEAFVPSFGIMGVGGIIAFVIGSVMLVDSDYDVFRVSLPMVAAFISASALLLIITLRLFLRVRGSAPVSGTQTLLGAEVECLEDLEHDGLVLVHGERWQAHSTETLRRGDRARITAVDGLHLQVEKLTDDGSARAGETNP